MTATPDTFAGRRLKLDCKEHGPHEMCTLLCLVRKESGTLFHADRPVRPLNLEPDEMEMAREVSAIIRRVRTTE